VHIIKKKSPVLKKKEENESTSKKQLYFLTDVINPSYSSPTTYNLETTFHNPGKHVTLWKRKMSCEMWIMFNVEFLKCYMN